MRDRKDVFDEGSGNDGHGGNSGHGGNGGDQRESNDEWSKWSGDIGELNTFWRKSLRLGESDGADAPSARDPGSPSNISPFPQPGDGSKSSPGLGGPGSLGQQPPGLGERRLGGVFLGGGGRTFDPRRYATSGPHATGAPHSYEPTRMPPPKLPARIDMPGTSAASDAEGGPMRAYSSFNDDRYNFYGTTLQQRRAEDERVTGRRWPTNALTAPVEPDEVAYFDQLAIALGEVSPRTLARASALRYVKAARTSQDDVIAATDIYAIIFFGLGLTVRLLDCSSLPQVLAVYHRATREVYLDRSLLPNIPSGPTLLDPLVWRRLVDASPLTRFLLAWCAGVHLTDNYDIPLVLGFAPMPMSGAQPQGALNAVNAANMVSSDTLNRYRKAMEATETLLAPAPRLWQQIAALNLPMNMGERDWRTRIRAIYGYTGPAYDRPGDTPAYASSMGHPSYGAQNANYNATFPDPAEQLVRVLAERNGCPKLFVESQLDGAEASPDWSEWSQRLTQEISPLHMRYLTASRIFGMASANGMGAGAAPGWGASGPAANPFSALGRQSSGPQTIQAVLSL